MEVALAAAFSRSHQQRLLRPPLLLCSSFPCPFANLSPPPPINSSFPLSRPSSTHHVHVPPPVPSSPPCPVPLSLHRPSSKPLLLVFNPSFIKKNLDMCGEIYSSIEHQTRWASPKSRSLGFAIEFCFSPTKEPPDPPVPPDPLNLIVIGYVVTFWNVFGTLVDFETCLSLGKVRVLVIGVAMLEASVGRVRFLAIGVSMLETSLGRLRFLANSLSMQKTSLKRLRCIANGVSMLDSSDAISPKEWRLIKECKSKSVVSLVTRYNLLAVVEECKRSISVVANS